MRKIIPFVSLFLLVLIQSCYVSKSLDREVKVSIDKNFTIQVNNSGNSNYSSTYSEEEYRQAFIAGMMAEFQYNKIIIDDQNPEFVITITEVKIDESTSTETVNDESSSDNGTTFELSKIEVNSKGLCDQKAGNHIKEWWASKDKEEKVTNSRSAGQMVTGSNKDNTEYRKKDFSDDVALDLVEKCGRRSATRIINDIVKTISR